MHTTTARLALAAVATAVAVLIPHGTAVPADADTRPGAFTATARLDTTQVEPGPACSTECDLTDAGSTVPDPVPMPDPWPGRDGQEHTGCLYLPAVDDLPPAVACPDGYGEALTD